MEARYGEAFVKHELDEAIAIQQAIVEAERQLAESHPHPAARETARTLERSHRDGSKALTATLAEFAAAIATKEPVAS